MSTGPILLTGSNGQVGNVLARSLLNVGDVVACDRNRMNLTDPEAVRCAVRELRPPLIVNAAAYTAVDQAENEPETADLVNHVSVGVMADEAVSCGASMVHFSTDYVFDGSSRVPYCPGDATNPLGVYGRTKRDGELAILESGVDSLIIRTSWVYSMRGRNFLLTMLRLAAERDELRVVDDQLGSPTWADWLARAATGIISGCCRQRAPEWFGERSGVYHLTNSGETTWCGFAQAIVAQMQLQDPPRVVGIPTCEYPTPAERPSYSVLDCSSTEEAFGLQRPNWMIALENALKSRLER